MTDNNLLLPFLIAPKASENPEELLSFHPNLDYPGCSSVNMPDRIITDKKVFIDTFAKNCRDYESLHPGEINLWDGPSSAQSTIDQATEASWGCYNGTRLGENSFFPFVSLHQVFLALDDKNIQLLDIDSQGSDVSIILSLGEHLHRVKHIKLECQTDLFLYKTTVPNNCQIAIDFLTKHKFMMKKLEVNNCGILEFNLYMSKAEV